MCVRFFGCRTWLFIENLTIASFIFHALVLLVILASTWKCEQMQWVYIHITGGMIHKVHNLTKTSWLLYVSHSLISPAALSVSDITFAIQSSEFFSYREWSASAGKLRKKNGQTPRVWSKNIFLFAFIILFSYSICFHIMMSLYSNLRASSEYAYKF